MSCRCSPEKRAKIKKEMQKRILETEQFRIAMSINNHYPKGIVACRKL